MFAYSPLVFHGRLPINFLMHTSQFLLLSTVLVGRYERRHRSFSPSFSDNPYMFVNWALKPIDVSCCCFRCRFSLFHSPDSQRRSVSHPPRLLCQMFHVYSLCLSFGPPTLFFKGSSSLFLPSPRCCWKILSVMQTAGRIEPLSLFLLSILWCSRVTSLLPTPTRCCHDMW